MIKRWCKGFFAAVGMYSVLPVTQLQWDDAVTGLLDLAGLVAEHRCHAHHLVGGGDDRDVLLPFLGHEAALDVLACNCHGDLVGSACLCECIVVSELAIDCLVGGGE